MGPYCKFCNQRCFRYIPEIAPEHVKSAYGTSTIAATCEAGKAFEREKIGVCADDFDENRFSEVESLEKLYTAS